jgi:hypothetical protein
MEQTACQILPPQSPASVAETLAGLCVGARTMSLAVGYLFVEGLGPLLPQLETLERVELLIGNVVNRLTEEQMREEQAQRTETPSDDTMFAHLLREERDRAALETALNIRRTLEAMPRTEENGNLLLALAALIAEGRLLVRLLTSRRLHAKVALTTYPDTDARAPGIGIVGSSNITLPPSQTVAAPADLDVQVEGAANITRLKDWFGAHWAEGQDFQKELFEELGRAWPLRTETAAR